MDNLRDSIKTMVEEARERMTAVSVNTLVAELAGRFCGEEAKKLMIARLIISECGAAGVPMTVSPGLVGGGPAILPPDRPPYRQGLPRSEERGVL